MLNDVNYFKLNVKKQKKEPAAEHLLRAPF